MNDELASLLQELESTTLEDYSMNSLLEETSNEVEVAAVDTEQTVVQEHVVVQEQTVVEKQEVAPIVETPSAVEESTVD